MLSGIAVCFDDDPGWGVGDPEIKDLAGGDEVVERIHQLWYRDR